MKGEKNSFFHLLFCFIYLYIYFFLQYWKETETEKHSADVKIKILDKINKKIMNELNSLQDKNSDEGNRKKKELLKIRGNFSNGK